MIEQIDDITKITLPYFMLPTNVYLVDDLLIDTGFPRGAKKALNQVQKRKITSIVNTHGHIDHIGGNGLLQEYFHCNIFLPAREQEFTTLEKILFGRPKKFSSRNPPNTIETENHTFHVIDTPGHASDHITLFESHKKLAFSGDLVLHGEAREVSREVEIYKAIESLKRLRALNPKMIFPGHGAVFHDPAILNKKITYLEELGDRIIALYNEGKSPQEIVQIVFDGEQFPYMFIKDYFSAENLVRAYINKSPTVKEK